MTYINYNTNGAYSLDAGIFLKNLAGNEGKLIGLISSSVQEGRIPGLSYMFAKEY